MTKEVLEHYSLPADVVACDAYGNGHINETYRVTCADGSVYILQKLNTTVFQMPDAVMHNIELVTAHLRARTEDPRGVLTFIPTVDGHSYLVLHNAYWRMFAFVSDSFCVDRADTPEQFGKCAEGFAGFFNLLRDFDAELLTETIPRFHDTPSRFQALRNAVEKDVAGRARSARKEIDFAYSYADFAETFAGLQAAGELPLRVTHNDTKINNLLFDCSTGKSLCVVDLDTVMPGFIMNDFGDAIRYGASTAAEDERDLTRVWFDMRLYEAYLTSFMRVCGSALTSIERMLLPTGAKMMTYETGIRFLTDYLSGDTYFHTAYAEHNLHRARTQLKLVQDMDAHWDEMQRIAKREARASIS